MSQNTGKSVEEVALKLSDRILKGEKVGDVGASYKLTKEEAREYWFNLYYQSLQVVRGTPPARVLPKKESE